MPAKKAAAAVAAPEADRLRVEYMPLAALMEKRHPLNPKSHDIGAIVTSFAQFGYVTPGVLDERTQMFAEGHGRTEALAWLKQQGRPAPQRIDVRADDWYVPVYRGVAFENDTKLLAFLVAANQLTVLGGWDAPKQLQALQLLAERDPEAFAATGFDADDVRGLMLDVNGTTEPGNGRADPGPKIDARNALRERWGTARGQLWRLPNAAGTGEHRLMIGDATDPNDVARLMGEDRAECMWTDPPYGVDYVGKTADALTIENDDAGGLDRLLADSFQMADQCALADGAAIYVAHPAGALSVTFGQRFLAQGWRLHETLVWVKDSMVLGHSDYHYRHEPLLFGYKKAEGRRGRGAEGWYGDNAQTSVLEFARPKASEEHPCLSPDSLVVSERGYVPVSEIEVGECVYAQDGQLHPVTDLTVHPYNEPIYRIEVAGTNLTVDATHNHPFLVARPTLDGRGSFQAWDVRFRDADALTVGDYLMTPVPNVPPALNFSLSDDLCFVIGLFLAEGTFQRAGHGGHIYPRFTIHKEETALIERIVRVGGAQVSIYPNGENGVNVLVFSAELGQQLLDWCGKGARTKSLSLDILSWQESARTAILNGYLAGDGSFTRGSHRAKTSSSALAAQLRLLGQSLGYKVSVHAYAARPASIAGRDFQSVAPYYQLVFTSVKEQRRTQDRVFEWNGQLWHIDRVKSLETFAYDGLVYNLCVDGSHTFQTAVGMSHNTMKPVELVAYCLGNSCAVGGVAYDPFGGSGTTMVACEQTAKRCRMLELDPAYAAVILERLAGMGLTPELING